jgi:5-hydroxyisourate hydrolase-like protein (transthyretin family)
VTVRASTLAPEPRATVTLQVRVQPKRSGVVVRRQKLVGRTWHTMATQRTDSRGRVAFTFRWPKARTTFTYRVVTTATATTSSGTSERFTIATRRR